MVGDSISPRAPSTGHLVMAHSGTCTARSPLESSHGPKKRRKRSKLVCQTQCSHLLASGAGLFALLGIVGIGEEWRWRVELNRRNGVRTRKVERIVTGKTQGWDVTKPLGLLWGAEERRMISIYMNGWGCWLFDTPPGFGWNQIVGILGRVEVVREKEPSLEGPWQTTQGEVGDSVSFHWVFKSKPKLAKQSQHRALEGPKGSGV